uniref:SFRICE_007817 n=1 Tax=Spodoptera frugiperda TaxID=7108 RepID=A0A2H1VEJ0_SPOFR
MWNELSSAVFPKNLQEKSVLLFKKVDNAPVAPLVSRVSMGGANRLPLGNTFFRGRSDVEVGLTEEEALYIDTLLATHYRQLGKLKFHEIAVSTIAILTAVLQATISTAHIDQTTNGSPEFHKHFRLSSPCALCVVLLFITPVNLDFLRYFKTQSDENTEPLPISQTKSCLNWNLVRRNIHWSIPLIIAGSSTLFESLRDSDMILEFEKFLLIFEGWPASALVFVVVLFCKTLTEFASNFCVVYALLPSIAKVEAYSLELRTA